jgi:hypothetical protein
VLPAGHGYDDPGFRFHRSATREAAGVRVEAYEAIERTGIELAAPSVYVDGEMVPSEMNATTARSVAAQLLAAADLLDEITGAAK